MSKTVIGLGVAAVAAVGGYFGTEAYIKHRIAGEIETNFAQIRAGGGQAKHGDLAFSLWTRNVTLSDIAVEFTAPQPAKIKVASFTASGIGLDSGSTFKADNIVLTDIDASGAIAPAGGLDVTVKAPRFEIADYSGPTRMPEGTKVTSPLDMYRAGLTQFAAVSARAMTAPTVTVAAKGTALPGGADYVYSDLTIRDIKDGKVATTHASRVNVAMSVAQPRKSVRMTGEIVDITAKDFDAAAAATVLDPAHASDEKFYRIQGQVSTGAYTLTSDNGPSFRIDGIRMGDMKIQPAKFKMQELLAVLPATGARVDPAKTRAMIETVASTYEGIQIDNAEMLGLSVQTPDGPIKLAAMRFNLDRGKVGEFAIEGLDGTTKEGPFKLGRFALKGFDFSGLMRQTSQMAALGTTPSTDSVVGMLKALESIELRDMVAPHKNSGKLITLHNASLSWGQFVGSIPSKINLKLKMTGPLEEKDGEPFTLLRDVGITEATADMDVGIAWNESEKKLVLTPGTFEIGKLFAINAKTSLDNVQRDLFTTDPQRAMMAALPIEYGAIEIVGRDLGAVDLSIAQYARKQNISTEQARSTLANEIRTKGRAAGNDDPVSGRLADAVASFIEKPNGTLALKITPRAKLPVLQFIELTKNDPSAMFSLFDIDIQNK
ncbi:hypothetical protein RPMA_13530 [Tardiphaga alba]|uniref:DUF945 domain-containing protein n=1 Tax=Tardiphaga alba TaxID=340268 RepID=A0ABX8A9R6_9BRAD|nr:hypothetical protein [Tardiphaga alba]QUS39746.1 hypothetical protein RPMA_13530 [Tardiphaga alba]